MLNQCTFFKFKKENNKGFVTTYTLVWGDCYIITMGLVAPTGESNYIYHIKIKLLVFNDKFVSNLEFQVNRM